MDNSPSMTQKIFKLGLSVETVSLYLTCTGLKDSNTEISPANIASVWSGSGESLDAGLRELEELGIIAPGEGVYELTDSTSWKIGAIPS